MRPVTLVFLLLAPWLVVAQDADPRYVDPVASGGPLIAEQAAYQVHFYDLSMRIDPARRAIEGENVFHTTITLPTNTLAIDLDTTFVVHRVEEAWGEEVAFERVGGRLFLDFRRTLQPGDPVQFSVSYAGHPRVAPRPPWEGGFTWVDRPDGTHWVGVSNQGEGADIWWPVKDHPSDRVDSMRIAFTVPHGHEAISNGRLVSIIEHDRERTFEWFVSTPISNYVVTVYVGPFEALEADYVSVAGEPIDFTVHVLPEAIDDARRQLPQFVDHMRFMEETFGPYPFRADKYAVVHAPYLGMEHQTAIAYGDDWQDNEYGFDWLHLHEIAHEWFANLVNVPDWSHMWVHEGFAMFIEALYAERIGGMELYHRYLRERMLPRIVNQHPIVPQAGLDTQEVYFGRTDVTDQDVYFKGAWVLHTVRWLFRAEMGEGPGDEAFFRALRRITYPDPALETDLLCGACRFVTTLDVQRAFEAEFGRELYAFFTLYLYQPELPALVVTRGDGAMRLRWEVPTGHRFDLPVEVDVDGIRHVIPMADGIAAVDVPDNAQVTIDPDWWILRERE